MSTARNQRRLAQKTGLKLNSGFAAGQEDDTLWFMANRGAGWRLRLAHPGESEAVMRHHWAAALQAGKGPIEIRVEPARCSHIITLEIKPGVRWRIPCLPPAEGPERNAWLAETITGLRRQTPSEAQLTPAADEARAAVLAWAMLPPGAADVSAAMERGFHLVGEAVRESRKAVWQ